jgi:TonB family protein
VERGLPIVHFQNFQFAQFLLLIMTFRRSIYLSIAAHVLIFSTAIAMAQYGHGSFVSYPHAVLVSLISEAPGPRGGEGMTQQRVNRPRTAAPQTVAVMSEPEQTAPLEAPADLSAASKVQDEGHTARSDALGTDVGTDDHGQAIASAAGAGQGENARTGFIAPQQWAAIQAAIERTKNYPRLARERGIEGEVRLRFRLDSAGSVEAIEIVKSSGYEILDTASIQAVYRAAPMPSVQGWIEVPIAYVLK